MIRQTQVNPKAGITFAAGLTSILRQDPDVIMVGEIRDLDTSEIAIQAALTDHLVLSTLHTNDAPEAITRLMDIGVEPYLISSSVIGVLAQRLVRAICPHCKTSVSPDEGVMKEVEDQISKLKGPPSFSRGKGCKQCKQSGYLGKKGIYELLVVNDKVKRLISEKASSFAIRSAANQFCSRRRAEASYHDDLSSSPSGDVTLGTLMYAAALWSSRGSLENVFAPSDNMGTAPQQSLTPIVKQLLGIDRPAVA